MLIRMTLQCSVERDENRSMASHSHSMPRVTTGLWSAMTRAVDEEIERDRDEEARARVCEMTFETSHASLDDFETLGESDWEFPPAGDALPR
jgi:hypothetical protein